MVSLLKNYQSTITSNLSINKSVLFLPMRLGSKSVSFCNMSLRQFSLFSICIFLIIGVNNAARFKLQNRCKTTIWPGIQPSAGHPQIMNGGLQLQADKSIDVEAPSGWSGRFWGRSDCSFDNQGRGTCLSGDCAGLLQCAGAGGVPPATLAEFTLDSPMDFYDISLVDGFNLPISITPLSTGTGNNCKNITCVSDLNNRCPQNLQVIKEGKVVACSSACEAFKQPQYCCTGEFGSPNTCKPSEYSKIFKAACPDAYSYAFDDGTSIFTCKGADYLISFC